MTGEQEETSGRDLPIAGVIARLRSDPHGYEHIQEGIGKILEACGDEGDFLFKGALKAYVTDVTYGHNIFRIGQARRDLSWDEYVAAGKPETVNVDG